MVKAMLSHIPTGNDFGKRFNLDYCMEKYFEVKTIEEALMHKKIKLRELSVCYGEEIMIGWIQAWLINLAGYMNFPITTQQAKTTAMFILEDCYMLNIVEFTLLFRKINRGNYGEFYGKFNGQIIMSACKQYRSQRGKALSALTEEEQKSLNQ